MMNRFLFGKCHKIWAAKYRISSIRSPISIRSLLLLVLVVPLSSREPLKCSGIVPGPLIEEITHYYFHVNKYMNECQRIAPPIVRKKLCGRQTYSAEQRRILEDCFQNNKYVIKCQRMGLKNRTNLADKQIRIWFQNRRAKEKQIIIRQGGKTMSNVKMALSSFSSSKRQGMMGTDDEKRAAAKLALAKIRVFYSRRYDNLGFLMVHRLPVKVFYSMNYEPKTN